jgi:hypothetical protein
MHPQPPRKPGRRRRPLQEPRPHRPTPHDSAPRHAPARFGHGPARLGHGPLAPPGSVPMRVSGAGIRGRGFRGRRCRGCGAACARDTLWLGRADRAVGFAWSGLGRSGSDLPVQRVRFGRSGSGGLGSDSPVQTSQFNSDIQVRPPGSDRPVFTRLGSGRPRSGRPCPRSCVLGRRVSGQAPGAALGGFTTDPFPLKEWTR